jgi:hypothetical protein
VQPFEAPGIPGASSSSMSEQGPGPDPYS